MNIQQREIYFKKTDPSQWSLIGFLKWRAQFPDFSVASIEHSAWKKFLEDIAKNVKDSASQRAKELVLTFKCHCQAMSSHKAPGRMPRSIAGHIWMNDKKSKVVQEFWKEHETLETVMKETRLQIAISDFKYVVKKSEEATIHSDIIGKRRSRILENEIKEPSPEIYGSSESPAISELNETADEKDKDSFSVIDDNDDSEYTPSDFEDQNPPPPLMPSQLKDFHKYFTNMNEDHKWILTSGKCVEDTLFEHCKELPNESLLHSWIIDLDDQEAEELFTTEEWNEIRHEVQLPEVDETFVKSMMRFADVKTTRELRQVLATTSFLRKVDSYSRENHFDAEWADISTYYEDPNEPLKRLHLESWYDINVWSHIVDHGLSDIFGMEIVRKESSSEAVSVRKNRKRAHKRYKKVPRKKMGYKMDGIFRTYINNIEYGAIEVAKKYDQTKLLADGFKLSKGMHDIFVCLCRKVDNQETMIRKLHIPGILHLGLKSQILQMSSPKGYVAILKRDKLLEVLTSVWKVKKTITDTMKIVLTPQEAYEFYRELIGQKSPTDEIDIPWSLDSIV
ncbi:3322_t:CDS:10 [Diversispora eburnea]|uniref:3322_t:CDS:1 n=1 Tax=Diversispora eburnea TaxID=1213867 RepID=A0A9N9CHX9_9GLOM|nr:3322_t:CDS:10 [Diversispora eburnea]